MQQRRVTQATDVIPGGTRSTGTASGVAPRSEVREADLAGSALRIAAGRADALALGIFGPFAGIALWLRFVYAALPGIDLEPTAN